MLRHFLTAGGAMLAALAALPGAALAQDAPATAPAASGFRLEVLTGYDDAAFDSITRGQGLLYGVGAGYDFRAGRMRIGVEAEASESTAQTCRTILGINGDICFRTARDLYVGGRIGGMIAPGVLLYGKAGYTNFRESNRFPPSLGSIVTHPEVEGWRVGLGAEFAIGRRMFVKTEYRFSAYENSQDFDRNQGVIGFGFRF